MNVPRFTFSLKFWPAMISFNIRIFSDALTSPETHKWSFSWIKLNFYRFWASPSAPGTLWTSVQSSPWPGRRSWSIQWFLVPSIRCWASCARNLLIDENPRQKERRRCVALHLSFPDEYIPRHIDFGFDVMRFKKFFSADFGDKFSMKFCRLVLAMRFQRNH